MSANDPGKTEGQPPAPPPPPAAPPAPTASPDAISVEKYTALEKSNAKLAKELEAAKKAHAETSSIVEKLKGVFGGDATKDPLAELNSLKATAEKSATEAARLRAERAISKVARQFEAHDEDDHFDAALKFGVLAGDGSVDGDKLTDFFTKQKASKAYLFKAPPPKSEAGPPGGTKAPPPAPAQPAAGNGAPPKPNNEPSFDRWISQQH